MNSCHVTNQTDPRNNFEDPTITCIMYGRNEDIGMDAVFISSDPSDTYQILFNSTGEAHIYGPFDVAKDADIHIWEVCPMLPTRGVDLLALVASIPVNVSPDRAPYILIGLLAARFGYKLNM